MQSPIARHFYNESIHAYTGAKAGGEANAGKKKREQKPTITKEEILAFAGKPQTVCCCVHALPEYTIPGFHVHPTSVLQSSL